MVTVAPNMVPVATSPVMRGTELTNGVLRCDSFQNTEVAFLGW